MCPAAQIFKSLSLVGTQAAGQKVGLQPRAKTGGLGLFPEGAPESVSFQDPEQLLLTQESW